MSGAPLLAVLVIAASSSTRPVLDRLRPDLEKAAGSSVEIRYGATGTLAAEVRKGSGIDLFLSGDERTVRTLVEDGLLEEGSVTRCATGSLALVAAEKSPLALPRRLDGATALAFVKLPIRKLAIPEPKTTPEGAAARDVLQAARIFQQMKEKLVSVEGADEAIRAVLSGKADVAIVAASLAGAAGLKSCPVDTTLHTPLKETAAVTTASTRKDAARRALDVLSDPAVREVWRQAGFDPP